MKQHSVWPVLDDHGLHKIPLRCYWLLLLLLRPYICWALVLTLPQAQRDMLALVYPLQHDFLLACLVALPLLLLLAAMSQRKPKGKMGWFAIWRHGKLILGTVALADLVVTVSELPHQVMLDAPWRIAAPVALIVSVVWVISSKTLKQVFAEWPLPVNAPDKD